MRGLVDSSVDVPPLVRYGFPDVEPRTTPAAGTDYTSTGSGRYIERLLTVWCRLVCDSNVAAREVVLQFLDANGNVYRNCGAPVTVSASTTIDYSFSVFQPTTDWPIDSTILVPLDPILIQPSLSWRLHVVNVQVADALSRIRVSRERFFSDSPVPARDYGRDQ